MDAGKAARVLGAIVLITAGLVLAGVVNYVLAVALGPPLVEFHNARHSGQMDIADGAFYFTRFYLLAVGLGGIGAAIALRKRFVPRNLAIGAAAYGIVLTALVEWLLYEMRNFSW